MPACWPVSPKIAFLKSTEKINRYFRSAFNDAWLPHLRNRDIEIPAEAQNRSVLERDRRHVLHDRRNIFHFRRLPRRHRARRHRCRTVNYSMIFKKKKTAKFALHLQAVHFDERVQCGVQLPD